ncbi:SLC13 family permease [Roseospirillum parvum]|uniref:TrkA-C domain-containing protein n=1 Tax=Roseospirillum parvum TaxID=83401 RepID=A0A1G8E3L1_9PROT|nr:SLC13 family permease [Roseospirillum parvum]SDH64542.1 TrkA-C domain-containing protein [Roseospirillum parvum]
MTHDLMATGGLSLEMVLVFAVVAVTVTLYVTEWVSLELASLFGLTALLVVFHLVPVAAPGGGTVGPGQILAGFGNPALLAVMALLVVGEGLIRTGALDAIAEAVDQPRLGPLSLGPTGSLVLLLALVALLSAFLNNTPVVVIFIPILQALAQRQGHNVSRLMMPLSFIAILGGMTTLIGSSTNLLVSNSLTGLGLAPLGFFEFTPLGLIMAVVGFFYAAFVLPRVLPERAPLASRLTGHGKQFLSQFVVPAESALVGARAVAGQFAQLPDVTVRMVQRGEHAELPPFDGLEIQAGDLLVVVATRAALTDLMSDHPGLFLPPVDGGPDSARARLAATDPTRVETAKGGGKGGGKQARKGDGEGKSEADSRRDSELRDRVLVESMVSPSSRMIGQNLQQFSLRRRFNCVVVGILRRNRMIRARMTEIRLEAGDVLLLFGRQRDIDLLRAERDLVVMSGTTGTLVRRTKARATAAVFGLAVGLAALGLIPIVLAAIGAASAMLALRALNLRQAARALDTKIFMVVACALGMGYGLEATGGAQWLAANLVGGLGEVPPEVMLSAFFLVVALFTNLLTNNACAVLFTPIAVSLAQTIGSDPRTFAVATLLAANASFAAPMGYQTNLLVMAPGHYQFADFVRGGLPLVLLLWLVFSLSAPLVLNI